MSSLSFLYKCARRSLHGYRARVLFVCLCTCVIMFVYRYILSISSAKIIPLHEIPQNLVPALPNLLTVVESQQLCDIMPLLNNGTWPVKYMNITSFYLENLAINSNIQPGGSWKPKKCKSQHHVALVIPYRDRPLQLDIFLAHMHPFLQFQQLDYQIFIIEQTDERPFNRAKLFNIGFKEAEKISSFHCFIFHDVDLLPLNINNIYGCTKLPRHLSAHIDVFDYKIPYDWIFGGAIAVLKDQFISANGFSNKFFGWGGEDDDFFNRITRNGTSISRFEPKISRYTMLSHEKETPSEDRYYYLSTGERRYESDGLNSLRYTVKKFELKSLYTHIIVDL